MKIPYRNILSNAGDFFRDYNNFCHDYLEIKVADLSVLLLCLMYHNKLITSKQLCLYLNRYSETSEGDNGHTERYLSRRFGTYHCKWNDKWYGDDSNFTGMLLQVCRDKCKDLEVSIETFLQYLNLGFGRNRNWCVDYLAFSIIKPALSYYDAQKSIQFFKGFGFDANIISYEEADRMYDLGSGYCCKDCDGCYSQYKYHRYEWHYKKDLEKELKDVIKTELMCFKKHLKNPNDKLLFYF